MRTLALLAALLVARRATAAFSSASATSGAVAEAPVEQNADDNRIFVRDTATALDIEITLDAAVNNPFEIGLKVIECGPYGELTALENAKQIVTDTKFETPPLECTDVTSVSDSTADSSTHTHTVNGLTDDGTKALAIGIDVDKYESGTDYDSSGYGTVVGYVSPDGQWGRVKISSVTAYPLNDTDTGKSLSLARNYADDVLEVTPNNYLIGGSAAGEGGVKVCLKREALDSGGPVLGELHVQVVPDTKVKFLSGDLVNFGTATCISGGGECAADATVGLKWTSAQLTTELCATFKEYTGGSDTWHTDRDNFGSAASAVELALTIEDGETAPEGLLYKNKYSTVSPNTALWFSEPLSAFKVTPVANADGFVPKPRIANIESIMGIEGDVDGSQFSALSHLHFAQDRDETVLVVYRPCPDGVGEDDVDEDGGESDVNWGDSVNDNPTEFYVKLVDQSSDSQYSSEFSIASSDETSAIATVGGLLKSTIRSGDDSWTDLKALIDDSSDDYTTCNSWSPANPGVFGCGFDAPAGSNYIVLEHTRCGVKNGFALAFELYPAKDSFSSSDFPQAVKVEVYDSGNNTIPYNTATADLDSEGDLMRVDFKSDAQLTLGKEATTNDVSTDMRFENPAISTTDFTLDVHVSEAPDAVPYTTVVSIAKACFNPDATNAFSKQNGEAFCSSAEAGIDAGTTVHTTEADVWGMLDGWTSGVPSQSNFGAHTSATLGGMLTATDSANLNDTTAANSNGDKFSFAVDLDTLRTCHEQDDASTKSVDVVDGDSQATYTLPISVTRIKRGGTNEVDVMTCERRNVKIIVDEQNMVAVSMEPSSYAVDAWVERVDLQSCSNAECKVADADKDDSGGIDTQFEFSDNGHTYRRIEPMASDHDVSNSDCDTSNTVTARAVFDVLFRLTHEDAATRFAGLLPPSESEPQTLVEPADGRCYGFDARIHPDKYMVEHLPDWPGLGDKQTMFRIRFSTTCIKIRDDGTDNHDVFTEGCTVDGNTDTYKNDFSLLVPIYRAKSATTDWTKPWTFGTLSAALTDRVVLTIQSDLHATNKFLESSAVAVNGTNLGSFDPELEIFKWAETKDLADANVMSAMDLGSDQKVHRGQRLGVAVYDTSTATQDLGNLFIETLHVGVFYAEGSRTTYHNWAHPNCTDGTDDTNPYCANTNDGDDTQASPTGELATALQHSCDVSEWIAEGVGSRNVPFEHTYRMVHDFAPVKDPLWNTGNNKESGVKGRIPTGLCRFEKVQKLWNFQSGVDKDSGGSDAKEREHLAELAGTSDFFCPDTNDDGTPDDTLCADNGDATNDNWFEVFGTSNNAFTTKDSALRMADAAYFSTRNFHTGRAIKICVKGYVVQCDNRADFKDNTGRRLLSTHRKFQTSSAGRNSSSTHMRVGTNSENDGMSKRSAGSRAAGAALALALALTLSAVQ